MNGSINNIIIQCPCCLFQFDSIQWLIGHLREIKKVCFCADEATKYTFTQLFCCKICFLNLQTANELADHLEGFHNQQNNNIQQLTINNSYKQVYLL
jgi:hypothetical protein